MASGPAKNLQESGNLFNRHPLLHSLSLSKNPATLILRNQCLTFKNGIRKVIISIMRGTAITEIRGGSSLCLPSTSCVLLTELITCIGSGFKCAKATSAKATSAKAAKTAHAKSQRAHKTASNGHYCRS